MRIRWLSTMVVITMLAATVGAQSEVQVSIALRDIALQNAHSGELSVAGEAQIPTAVALRLAGPFVCNMAKYTVYFGLLSNSTKETIYFKPPAWAQATLEPQEDQNITFGPYTGAFPLGMDWDRKNGPTLHIKWDLGLRGNNTTYTYNLGIRTMNPNACVAGDGGIKASSAGTYFQAHLGEGNAAMGPNTSDDVNPMPKTKGTPMAGAAPAIVLLAAMAFTRIRRS